MNGQEGIYAYLALSQEALRYHQAAVESAVAHFEPRKEIEASHADGLVYLAVAQVLAA